MKLGLFVDGSFLPSREGITQRIYLLAKFLPKFGIETVVFHCYRGWSDINLMKQQDFTTYLLTPESYYNFNKSLSNIILNENVDIIQMCDPSLILSQGLKLKQSMSVILIWEVHEVVSSILNQLRDLKRDSQFHSKLDYYSSICCDHVICFTEEDRLDLLKNGVSSDKISIFPCGVDIYNKKFFGPNLSSSNILFLGNMFYEPNYRAASSIAEIIYPAVRRKKEHVRFYMVGTCPKELEHQFSDDNFFFMGGVEDIDHILSETTIALSPVDVCSGMRIKILDYMAAGLPVISTSKAATGIKHGDSILIEDDLQKFANKILYLLDSPEKSQILGRKARMQIEMYYNWENIASNMSKFYNNVCKHPLNLNDKSIDLPKSIEQLILPVPYWLEETLLKRRFIESKFESLNCPILIKNHEILTP